MALCPKCGADNAEGSKFCTECGTPLLARAESQSTYTPPENPAPDPQPVYTAPQNPYGQAQFTPPTRMPTGGLLAWAIITCLFCLIPGIVAVIQVLAINSAPTAEMQKQKYSSARTWCIVATVLGVLAIIANVLLRMYGVDVTSRIIG